MEEIRKCKQCGKEFTAIRATHIYCSRSCRLEGNYNGVRKAYKRLYEERKQNGLCVYCGMPAESGLYCPECKEKKKIRSQKAYQKRKAEKQAKKRKTLANIISDIERYNSEHGTRLSYGKYIAMKEMGKIV